ncbi:hypothetical protein C4D60_Mb03t02700 [Musa balbisiana]|uniref:Thioredoxin domain-containing protein n=1 Tax=Musa balbisiana TaxID=52838 RepID=A0A4S8J745_MUSBA|nr:hypothetical protein C4D60_Mb03t02700 [Musa balbisiana]
MATCSAPSIVTLKASNPMASLAPARCPPSRAPALPKGFLGLRASKGFRPLSTRLASANRSSSRSFCVKAAFEVLPFDLFKYVILFFYPLDFTVICPTEITAFSDRYSDFEKLNTEILGVSVDSVVKKSGGGLGDLKYPLISDVTKSISKYFGVLIPDQSLQYVQENPDEVCPTGWKPGEMSMKPDPNLSKEYFAYP